MSEQKVVEALVRYGRKLYNEGGSYTGDPKSKAERFIITNKNAWLMGVLFDGFITAERAWLAPLELKERLGHFNMRKIATMPVSVLRRKINEPPALHFFVGKMPRWLKKAAKKLVKEYDGDASNIWNECLKCVTAGEVIERLKEFDGIGQKKAYMAARILHDDEEWDFKRWDQINVAVDTHIRTVWRRAGLSSDLSVKGIMASATRLRPRYPGELDSPAWDIGRNWCHKRRADCRGERHKEEKPCPLGGVGVCPRVGVTHR